MIFCYRWFASRCSRAPAHLIRVFPLTCSARLLLNIHSPGHRALSSVLQISACIVGRIAGLWCADTYINRWGDFELSTSLHFLSFHPCFFFFFSTFVRKFGLSLFFVIVVYFFPPYFACLTDLCSRSLLESSL
jgi:hypothetical protein